MSLRAQTDRAMVSFLFPPINSLSFQWNNSHDLINSTSATYSNSNLMVTEYEDSAQSHKHMG